MGYFRILLIPLFSWMYCTADSAGDYYAAAAVVGISGLTDMFDGKIARRFNMITELGKFIDPLADKLTQAAPAHLPGGPLSADAGGSGAVYH